MLTQIILLETFDAHGGPEKEYKDPSNISATPTRKGRYIVGKIEKHVSYGKYNFWSAIPWGSPLRLNGKILEVQLNNKWIPITQVNAQWSKLNNEQAIFQVKYLMSQMYYDNKVGQNHSEGYFIPNRWYFNDFGHVSIKYFEDKNGNRKLDKGEHILGDFIHTTPDDELLTRISKIRKKNIPFNLVESHGCIHVKPNDIDSMIAKGYLAIGNVVQVHKYDEKVIPQTINIPKRISQYEAHFFPGLLKMVIYKAPLR